MATPQERRPTVLVESWRPGAREAQAERLRRAGFEVTTCPGPRRMADAGCPLAATGECDLVAAADAVVYDLDLDDAQDREVLWLLRSSYPDLPVVVEVTRPVANRHRHLLIGCAVVPTYSSPQLGAVVHEAITHGIRPPEPEGRRDHPMAWLGRVSAAALNRVQHQAGRGLRSGLRRFYPR